jgi:hypothetical protein
MTNTDIERLLRQRPEVAVPPGLHVKLRSQIALEPARDTYVVLTTPWWRRWAPALSIALLMIACLVVIAVQTGELRKIRAERQLLEQQLDGPASRHSASATLTELEDSIRRIEEAQRLRAEIEELKQQLIEAEQLAKQNESFRAQLAELSAKPAADDPFAAQKAKAERIQCINNIKQIALATLMWGHDHGQVFPPDFQAIQDQLKSPSLLTCPSDTANLPPAKSWNDFDPGRVSYDWLAAGHRINGPRDEVITRCRVHFNVGNGDGSAQQWNRETMEYVNEDGIVKVKRKVSDYE